MNTKKLIFTVKERRQKTVLTANKILLKIGNHGCCSLRLDFWESKLELQAIMASFINLVVSVTLFVHGISPGSWDWHDSHRLQRR